MSNGKATYDNSINSWIDKKDIIIQNESFSRNINGITFVYLCNKICLKN